MVKHFEEYQIDALKLAFEESDHLTKDKKIELAKETGLDMEQISSWFNRKRVRKRKMESVHESEQICAQLKQSLQECKEREATLQMEVQESIMRGAKLGEENQYLKRRLLIADSDIMFESLLVNRSLKLEASGDEMVMVKCFEEYQIDALKLAFEESNHLTKDKKIELAKETGLDMEQISSWFNRKRVCKRKMESVHESEQICAQLKQSLQYYKEREVELRNELHGSIMRAAKLEEENQYLKRKLMIVETDKTFDFVSVNYRHP